MIERTCVLVKPDGVRKNLIGTVIARFEKEGLVLAGLRMMPPDSGFIEKFYGEHKGKPFYEALVQFMTSGPIVACVWEGDNAISRVRAINGATDSKKAEPGTLRNLYGTDGRMNLVHASDSSASAKREISLIFKGTDLTASQPISAVV